MAGKTAKEARKGVRVFWEFLIWIVGILVSLAVGSGMKDGTLTIPFIPNELTFFAGWVVVILTVLGLILAIIDYFT